jgi:hypothetical protein
VWPEFDGVLILVGDKKKGAMLRVHGVMMLIGRLIVMGRLCELHVLLLVDSTWDTFFYRNTFFYTVAWLSSEKSGRRSFLAAKQAKRGPSTFNLFKERCAPVIYPFCPKYCPPPSYASKGH